jgi:peroxiredoxin family protein
MKEKGTIVVFSDNLDRVLAALNIATGAAAMDMEVTLFFTFWGLNVIRKNRSGNISHNWMKKMLALLNRGGADRLKLSKFHMGGIGTCMMKKLMRRSRMPSVTEMLMMAKKLGVTFIACNTTMEIMGVRKEDLIPEVDSVAGVATYVARAQESTLNLFI